MNTNKENYPIILVDADMKNHDKYNWDDTIGEVHHFPNIYINKITTGRKFIYYRPNSAGYFGSGVIADVTIDPSTQNVAHGKDKKWYCNIIDYKEFKNIVPARDDKIGIFEDITNNRAWGNVRSIDQSSFDNILSRALVKGGYKTKSNYTEEYDQIEDRITEPSNELIVRKVKSYKLKKHSKNFGYYRRSDESKAIGDLGESLVFRILKSKQDNGEIKDLKDVSKDNVGYDIEYKSLNDDIIGVEVKATKMSNFKQIHITRNEWAVAKQMGERYHLYLIADCKKQKNKYQIIKNLFQFINDGKANITPLDYKIDF
jgi:hypothetical protein